MATLKRLGIYLLIFIVLLSISATLTKFWQELDYAVYRNLYFEGANNVQLTDDIVLVDLPHKTEGASSYDRENFRLRLANLLDTIGARCDRNERPEAVVLDIYFENEPQAKEALVASLAELRKKKLKVYGVYNMLAYKRNSFEENEDIHIREIYENYLEGYRLHTMFEERMGVLFYKHELYLPRNYGGYEVVEALVSKVARDLNVGEDELVQYSEFVVPLGNEESINNHTYPFIHAGTRVTGGTFSRELDITEKVIIVGSLEADYLKEIDKTGTHLLAWALYDQFRGNALAKQPLDHPAAIITLILLFAFFTVLIFALIFKYVKRLQTKPLLIAILSFVAGTLLLLAFGAIILVSGKVIPVGLILMGMFIAALLAWRYAHKFLVTGIAEGGEKYDVFISYSRGNKDWVIKNVYEPLNELRTSEGDKLNIFFDQKSIGIGEAFTSKYMWGIVDSRFFIPIISDEYYGKNHCKNEMDLAYKRSVEKLINILPIAFSYEVVPQIYTHINFSDISKNPDFFSSIKNELLKIKQP
jgi:hypothetical protein